jgi:hypothetical protein
MAESPAPKLEIAGPSIRAALDARFWLVAFAATIAVLLAYGLVAAILPNPVFGREIAPDAAAITIWLLSAPLIGLLVATYVPPAGASGVPARPAPADAAGSGRAALGALATFFAIGCPLCNKIVLVALGTSGALNLFAPIQPIIGLAGLTLLAVTLALRLRRRAEGCPLPAISRGA